MREFLIFTLGVFAAPWLYFIAASLLVRLMRRRRRRLDRWAGRREYEMADPITNAALHIAANEGVELLKKEGKA